MRSAFLLLMEYLLGCVGLLFIGFRIWLSFIKLKPYIQYERFFTSRFISIYSGMALVLGLKVEIFNLVLTAAFPMMIFCFFYWDVPFLFKILLQKPILPKAIVIEKTSLKIWLLLERFTVHLPIVIIAMPWYFQGLKGTVFPHVSPISFIVAILLVFIPFVCIDPRITKKKLWPEGLWLSGIFLLSAIGFYLHFFIFWM